VDQIAAQAAVSKQTVYKHFADKEQLFARIILDTADQVDGLVSTVTGALADTSDLDTNLRELAHQFVAKLMQPQVPRPRRLVIANADRSPRRPASGTSRASNGYSTPWHPASST
jgi:TetR/AcrR family transcriptional repressor of mexJK operon